MPTYTIRDNKTNEVRNNQTFSYYSACDELARMGPNWQRTHYLHNDGWRDNQPESLDLTEFGFEPIKDHFLMIDEGVSTDAVYVTYFADEWQGAKDRRTSPTKLGRYLKQFYPHLTDDDVTTQSTTIFTKLLKMELKVVYTADEIQEIYEESHNTNAGSCMSWPINSGQWQSWQKEHPVRAYAGPDLALAYVRKPSGELLGRALVWPEKMIFGSTYGNYDKMRAALKQAGYTSNGSFNGARMSRIVLRKQGTTVYLACPYLDDTGCCYDDGEYLVMGRNTDLENKSGSTGGYITVNEYLCAISGEMIPSSRQYEVLHPVTATAAYIHIDLKDEHSEYLHGHRWLKTDNENDYQIVGSGERIPKGAISAYYRQCAVNRKYYFRDQGVATSQGWVCHEVFFSDYVVCQVTKTAMLKTEAAWMEHGAWWHPNAFRDYGVTVDGKHYARVLQQVAA